MDDAEYAVRLMGFAALRIFIADDHPLYLSAVREQAARLFPDATIETAASFPEILETLRKGERRDLVLIDYCMPGMCGRTGIQAIVTVSRCAPVIVMSGVAIAAEVSACIGAGVKAFLPKTLDSKVFASALNVVLAGGSYLPAEMFGAPGAQGSAPAEPPGDGGGFTERERTIMAMLVNGLSNKEIARQLNLREVTIKVQLTRIYTKLGAKNRAQAATLMAQGHVLA